jgi:hypothetical protein
MSTFLEKARDPRQFPQWIEYLKKIGWEIRMISGSGVAVRRLPLGRSVIKVQHPVGKLDLKKINALSREEHALLTLIEPGVVANSDEDFKKNGYRVGRMHIATTATTRIDLRQSLGEIFSDFSENTKRNIRKSEKNQLKIVEIKLKKEKDNKKDWDKFYALFKNLSQKRGFYISSYEELYKKMLAFSTGSSLLFAYAPNDPEPIAAVWWAYYGNVCFYVQTGIIDKGYEMLANYLLVWELLQRAKKRKLEVFDFESIYDDRYPNEFKNTKGYSEFKKKFGGEVILFPKCWIKCSPWFLSYIL